MAVSSVTGTKEALKRGEARFDAEYAPRMFPRWYGVHLWRWLTKYFRTTPKGYAREWYVVGYLDGAQERDK